MHPRQPKLMLHWTRKPSLVYRAIVFSLTLSFGLPIPTARAAASKEQLLQVGSFMGLAGAIWRLNKAMRAMADSPLEKAKRDEVNAAMAAVPSAIQGLAGDFQSQKLGNSSLPIVLSMLGGFVDKNAADNYSKFLKNPSAGNIPKLGADFPAEAKNSAEADKLFYETVNREALAATKNFSPVGTTPVIAEGQQIVNLQNFGSGTRGLSQSSGASSGLFYDRDAPVSGVTNDAKKTGSNGSRPSSLAQTKADIAQIESGISGLTILNPVNRKKAEELEQTEMEASEMFKSVGKEDAKPKEKRRKISKPLSFHGLPVFRLASLVIFGSEAHAAQAQVGGQQGMQPESGSKAAEILFGMAAIIGAVIPVFIASSQAQSQQDAAETQAKAQIQMTQISAQTSIDLANMSANTAREQAAITQELAQKQLDAKKENLNINLQALAQQRQEVRDAEREQLAIEKEFNQQRIALAQKQLDENIKVSQAALNAQIVQSGLATGLTTTQGDPNRLAVTSLQNGVSTTANANTATTANATAGLGGALDGAATATGLTGAQRLGLKSGQPKSSSTLMAAALGTPVDEVEKAAGVAKKKNTGLGLKKNNKALGLTNSASSSAKTPVLGTARGAYAHGLAAVASGSFPNERQVSPVNEDADSDLEKFRVAAANEGDDGRSFSEWRTQRFEQASQQGALHRDNGPAANRHGL